MRARRRPSAWPAGCSTRTPAASASSTWIRFAIIGGSRKSVGYLSQRFSLYGDLSIDENIAFFAEIHGVGDYRRERDRLLEMTQLTPFRSRLADKLSGGMKQKLALACTLVHQPALILLDEPTTGVDPVSRREFWKLLSEFLAQGITIVMATPYLDEAERCSRVALLHEGQLLAVDTPDALRAALPGAIFEIIADDHRRAYEALRQVPGVTSVQMFGERAHARLAQRTGGDESVTAASGARDRRPSGGEHPAGDCLSRGCLHRSSGRGPIMTPTPGAGRGVMAVRWLLFAPLVVAAPPSPLSRRPPPSGSPSTMPSRGGCKRVTGWKKWSIGATPLVPSPPRGTRRRSPG